MERKSPTYWEIIGLFFKIGLLGFGGPYSLLSFLERELVEDKKWLTFEEFWESVAVGQLTPGPVFFACAVYCGYRLKQLGGALVAAIAVTFPGFCLALLLSYLYVYIQKLPELKESLTLLLAAVTGLILSVVWRNRVKFFFNWKLSLIAVLALILIFVFKVNAIAILVGAGIFGSIFLPPKETS